MVIMLYLKYYLCYMISEAGYDDVIRYVVMLSNVDIVITRIS